MLKLTNYDYNWKHCFGDEVVAVAELPPVGSNQKSFYGKAKVSICMDNAGKRVVYLLSYDTVVAMVRYDHFYRLWSEWSATTAKHVNAFRAVFGLPKINKKDWLNLPCCVYNYEKQVFE